MDLGKLQTELLSDPKNLGYAALLATGQDATIADMMNAVSQSIDIPRGLIPAHEIVTATVPSEWDSLSAMQKQRYDMFTGAGFIQSDDANIQAAFVAMFPTGSTITALAALILRKGSRAEELDGIGATVDSNQVSLIRIGNGQ